jgi:hypothetical protein
MIRSPVLEPIECYGSQVEIATATMVSAAMQTVSIKRSSSCLNPLHGCHKRHHLTAMVTMEKSGPREHRLQ